MFPTNAFTAYTASLPLAEDVRLIFGLHPDMRLHNLDWGKKSWRPTYPQFSPWEEYVSAETTSQGLQVKLHAIKNGAWTVVEAVRIPGTAFADSNGHFLQPDNDPKPMLECDVLISRSLTGSNLRDAFVHIRFYGNDPEEKRMLNAFREPPTRRVRS